MSKLQLYTISATVLLFLVLLFGFDTKPDKQAAIEQARALRAETTDISSLLIDAKAKLSGTETTTFLLMEQSLEQAGTDSMRLDALEQLSRKWFDLGHPEISGHYAERIADLTGTEEAWSIAGTTYTIGIQRSQEEKIKVYCSGRAVQAFENAISLNPEEVAHKINLALCYTEYPPQNEPMKGVLMLVDLNKKYPDNVSVLTNLGRLAIKTGQYARAVERLERAVSLEEGNARAHCLLVSAYEGLGEKEKAEASREKCAALVE